MSKYAGVIVYTQIVFVEAETQNLAFDLVEDQAVPEARKYLSNWYAMKIDEKDNDRTPD